MVASRVMKTLTPLLPKLGTPIRNNGPQERKQTQENMETAGAVSACKDSALILYIFL